MVALHLLLPEVVEILQHLDHTGHINLIRLDGKRPALVMLDVRNWQAKGRQDAWCCRDNGGWDGQHSSQAATVHGASPTERYKRKLPWVITTAHGNQVN